MGVGHCCKIDIPKESEFVYNHPVTDTNNKISNNDLNNTPMIEINEDLTNKKYMWIDPAIYNYENKGYYENLTSGKNIKIERFENIDEGYNFLIKEKNNFKCFVIIISGKLFNDFYYRIKRNINSINFSYNIIIFTSRIDLVIKQLKMNNIYYFNDLFNTKLIFDKISQIEDYIDNKFQEESDLTFDIIDNLEQLIIPNYYQCLLNDVNEGEIKAYNDYLIEKFGCKNKLGNKEIHKLICRIQDGNLQKQILIKFWLKIYTLQSDFYIELNESLRKKDRKKSLSHYPFIRLCYECIKNGFVKSYPGKIYRYSKISKEEFNEINIKFNSNENKSNSFPSMIVFSRSFLSFSKDKSNIVNFKGNNNSKDYYSILYTIEEIKCIENIENKISNAEIESISEFKDEKEVLVFPYSCFEIVEIKEIKNNGIDYKIKLKYLGYYSKYIEEQIGKNFLDKIQISHFSEELIKSGIVKIQNFFCSWAKKKYLHIKLDKICFFLDGQEDFIGFLKNEIYVYNIHLPKLKQVITIHNKQILNVIKLTLNRICSSSEDGTIQIIRILMNNEKYQPIKRIDAYANKIAFLNDKNLLYLDEINFFRIYNIEDEANPLKELFEENDKILTLEKINEEKIVYLTEDEAENKIIKFINVSESKKEENQIRIHKENNQNIIFINLLIFNDYIILGFNLRIDIINYKDKNIYIKSLKYFDFEINQIISLSSNRLILGFHDPKNKDSIIREQLLSIRDLKNEIIQFDCIGQGILENEKIENIIKINESQILINVKNKYCLIYERKNEVSEKLKQSLIALGKYKEEEKIINKEINIPKNNNSWIKEIKSNNQQVQDKQPSLNVKTEGNIKFKKNIDNSFINVKINEKNELNKSNKIYNNPYNPLAYKILKDLPEAYSSGKYENKKEIFNNNIYSNQNYA